MKPEIHQAFCHIGSINAVFFFEMTQVDNTFMRHPFGFAGKKRSIVRLQPRRQVIGVQYSQRRGLCKSFGAQQFYVSMRDEAQQCISIRRRRHRRNSFLAACFYHAVRRKKWR